MIVNTVFEQNEKEYAWFTAAGLEHLVKQLVSNDTSERREALNLLVRIGKEAEEVLAKING